MKDALKVCILVTGGYIIFKAGEASSYIKMAHKIAKEVVRERSF